MSKYASYEPKPVTLTPEQIAAIAEQVGAGYEPVNANIQAHVTSSHAPANAEANINADWNAVSGDAQILNKPTISEVDYSIVLAYSIAL